MFKNAIIYRLPAPWAMTTTQLEQLLTPQAFTPCSGQQTLSQGWLSPRNNGMLVHTVNRQMLIKLGTEKKLLPSSVINDVTKARVAEIEQQQGFAPGRKQLRELKEDITDELLPRAFPVHSATWAWIDTVNGWLVVDASNSGRAEDVLKLLIKAIDKFPVESLRTEQSPVAAMTNWLLSDEVPTGFTVDQDTELRSTGEGKATVRYIRHTLEVDDTRRHIEAGKQCTRLAMTWDSKISFVLTEGLTLKRIAALDVLKQEADDKNDDERFDSEFALMAGELNRLFLALVDALGGQLQEEA